MNERTKELVWQVSVFIVLSAILLFGMPAQAQDLDRSPYVVNESNDQGESASDLLSNVKASIAGMRAYPVEDFYPSLSVESIDSAGMVLEIVVPKVRTLKRDVFDVRRDFVRIDGFGHTMEAGWPQLPVGYFTIPLPDGRSVRSLALIEADEQARTDLHLALLASVFDEDAIDDLETDGETGVFPGDLLQGDVVHGDDGSTLLGLSVYPVQWEKLADNTQVVTTYRRIRVRVIFE